MEVCQPYTERFLLTMTFYAADYPVLNQSGVVKSPLPILTHTVRARVTNTEDRRLTLQSLWCVSLSLPDLYCRLTRKRPVPALLHLAQLQADPLPLDYRPPTRPTPQPDPRSRGQTTRIRRFSLDHSSALSTRKTPVAEVRDSLWEGEGADWLLCDGSFVPSNPGKEWTSVKYAGREFSRAFSRVIWTDDTAADILGRCNITDYTVYEQFVHSVDVDILQEAHSDRRGLFTVARGPSSTPTEGQGPRMRDYVPPRQQEEA